MKTNYFKSIWGGISLCISIANHGIAQIINPCGTTEVTKQLHLKYPELVQQTIDYNNAIAQKLQQKSERSNTLHIIPIVFHVLHLNGSENISDASIIAQVDRLNTDFRKLNSDINQIVNGFDTLAADINIEFRLAKIDPNGNCTNGIERIYSHRTLKGDGGSKIQQWPREKYLNVWVVKDIDNGNTNGTTLAYALKPPDVAGSMYFQDGIVMLSSQCNGNSRTLTHEIGHWLNLDHPWGPTNEPEQACGDDAVSDTPETKGHFGVCPLNDTTCSKEKGITPGIIENVQNYMEYSQCNLMFTKGQRERMRTALESSVSARNNLPTSTNLAATGTDGNATSPCVPKPEFYANRKSICAGGSVTFTKFMLNASSNSFLWSFPGGNPATSTQGTPTVTYNTPGTYDVTLTATNSAGTDTTTKKMFIRVNPDWADFYGLFSESFEDNSRFFNYWSVNDMDNNENTWYLTADAGYNSNQSVFMKGFNNYLFDIDELVSPSFDLSLVNNATLTFRCAGASMAADASDLNDVLKIYYSINCGQSWTQINSQQGGIIDGTDLINNGYNAGYFIPNSPDQWALHTVNIPNNATTNNVRFKFEYETGNESNNIFIDDININGTLSIDDGKDIDENSLSIYPNPSNKNSTVFYHLNEKVNTKIEVIDVLGKKVHEVINNNQDKGDYSIIISKQELNLKNGIYFVKLIINNSSVTKKLIFTE